MDFFAQQGDVAYVHSYTLHLFQQADFESLDFNKRAICTIEHDIPFCPHKILK